MALQRQGNVKGRAPSGHANRHAKPGCKEPITLILGQAPSTTSLVPPGAEVSNLIGRDEP